MKHLSLKARLMVLITGLAGISLLVFGLISLRTFNAVNRSKELVVKNAAENVLDKLDRNLFERYGDVQAFALSEPARSGDKERLTNFMTDMMQAYAPIYHIMMVVNTKGKVVAVNSTDKEGKPVNSKFVYDVDYSNEEWFQKAIAGEIKKGTSYVEDLHVDEDVAKIYSNSGHIMSFSAPITHPETGKLLGVWNNRISWDDVVAQIIKEETTAIKTAETPHVLPFLMNSKGTFLVHPAGNEYVLKQSHPEFARLAKTLETANFVESAKAVEREYTGSAYSGIAKSKGYGAYPGVGWIAQVQVPTSDPAKTAAMWLIGIALALIGVAIIFSLSVVNSLNRQFQSVISELSKDAVDLNHTAGELNSASQELAAGATEQASSLQETASSIEEISAMVTKSADSATRSIKVASGSQQTAARGQETVEQMMQSIQQISESNHTVMGQFEQNNQQLSEIIKVISEIGQKTKVINDIVFQTKLLSFNASVEAARAGEHGKGFAVVAEEVGNLAQMSGNAAKEIGDMLNSSISTVQRIVDETKSRAEKLINENKAKIEEGNQVASDCKTVLEEIVKNENEINIMINEISTASQEQATGVSEINKAIAELDKVTHQTSSVAQTTASQSDLITSKAGRVSTQVQTLQVIVSGRKAAQETTSQQATSAPAHSAHAGTPHQTSHNSKNNVVPFRATKAESRKPLTQLKTAVGAEESIPSENDPRFLDV